jgi:phosphatidylserine decarboxylase
MLKPFYEIMVMGRPVTEDHQYQVINERMTTVIEGDNGNICVVQIADSWIDRIVSFVTEGARIERGARIGMIRFGSQCDVFLPSAMVSEITVKKGQYVYAGRTAVASQA